MDVIPYTYRKPRHVITEEIWRRKCRYDKEP